MKTKEKNLTVANFFDPNREICRMRLSLVKGNFWEKRSILEENVVNVLKVERVELQFLFCSKFCILSANVGFLAGKDKPGIFSAKEKDILLATTTT